MVSLRTLLREATTGGIEDQIFRAIEDERVSQAEFNKLLHEWVKATNPALSGKALRKTFGSYNTTYLSGQWTPGYAAVAAERQASSGFSGLGLIVTPFTFQYLRSERLRDFDAIGIDNGMFSPKGRASFAWDRYEKMIKTALAQEKREVLAKLNFFAIPDEPFDWPKTLEKFNASKERVKLLRSYEAPAALCIQNGATVKDIPWEDIDVIFIGGDDQYKEGPDAEAISKEARRRGKGVHMGRVNNNKRLNTASRWQADSADGTYLKHELGKLTHEIERRNPRGQRESEPAYYARLKRILHGEHGPGDLHPDNTNPHPTESEIVTDFVNFVVDIQHHSNFQRRYDAIADLVRRSGGRVNKRTLWEYDRFLPQVPGMEDEDVVEFDQMGNVLTGRDGKPLRNQDVFSQLNMRPPYRELPPGIPFDPRKKEIYNKYMNRHVERMRQWGVMSR